MNRKNKTLASVFFPCILTLFCLPALGQQDPPAEGTSLQVVRQALMCESVKDGLPVNEAIVFDVSKGAAYCWSDFDPVAEDGVVYHQWYRRGKLVSKVKLAIHPPRWAAYSSLKLRQADIGPWRLNITDEEERVLKVLRFSITE